MALLGVGFYWIHCLSGAWQVSIDNPYLTLMIGLPILAYIYSHLAAPKNLPPGPTGYPVIGCTECYMDFQLEQKMMKWKETYGNIISYYKPGQLVVVLNDEQTIREAFVKQGEDYAERDSQLNFFPDIDFGSYTDEFKKFKKLTVSSMKQFGFGTYKSEENVLTQFEFIEDIISKSNGAPMDFNAEMRQLACNVILSIVMGGGTVYDDTNTTECLAAVDNWVGGMYEAWGGLVIAGMVPKFPLKSWLLRRHIRKIMEKAEADIFTFCERILREHAVDIANREPEDVVDCFLKEKGTDDATITKLCTEVILTLPDAIDSNCNLQRWLLQYVMADAALQETLHKEIADVIGQARKPALADRANMPHTQAVIHEVLRLIVDTPISLPRVTKKNLTLNGYNIPAGTEVVGNFYGIHNDPDIFPEPEKFKPARFIDSEGNFDNVLAGRLVGFGLGPRKCSGETYIKSQIFLFLARILQCYRIEFDASEPKPAEFTEGMTSILQLTKPEGYKMCFFER